MSEPHAIAVEAPRRAEDAPSPGAAPASGPRRGGHMPELDGLRGLAILLVMLFHFAPALPRPTGPASTLVARAFSSGWCGVDLFFALSGFLITGILADTRSSARYFRAFYARRALRIFPLYYGVLAAAFLVLPALGLAGAPFLPWAPREDQAWFWLYGVNVLRVLRGPEACGNLEHFWSLAVEEHFYLVWPLLVLCLGRVPLMRLCTVILAAAPALRLAAAWRGGHQFAYMFTLCRIDAMAAGALLALAARGPRGLAGVAGPARWAVAVGGVVLAALVARGHGVLYHLGADVQALGYTALAAFFTGAMALAVASPSASPLARLLRAGPLRLAGQYSYGLYVYHFILAEGLLRSLPSEALGRLLGSPLLGGLASIALAMAASFAAAWVSWHALEKHVLGLKRHFPY